MKVSEKWYEDGPKGVAHNEEVNILWDVIIQCDRDQGKEIRYCSE